MIKTKPNKLQIDVRPTISTMVYDGDCSFCTYWINRWKTRTREKIRYISYQECGDQFSPLSENEFQTSVFLILPNGIFLSGAGAVFRSLTSNRFLSWFNWIYNRIRLFRILSESVYSFIAANRNFFSKVTKLLWGNNTELPSYHISRWLFLKFIAVIYCIGFTSFWVQWKGLVGPEGILPITEYFNHIKNQVGNVGFLHAPSLQWFFQNFGGMDFICISGMIFSILLLSGILPGISAIVLWLLYLSVYTGGQRFLSFQWDILLLETGFLSIFVAPFCFRFQLSKQYSLSGGCVFLMRWLLFRLMFFSGVTKLASGDPVWTDLTALTYHYETQPLATWTAWYIHQLPVWFHQLSTGFMFFVELIIPFFIFGPQRVKLCACFYVTLLMGLILLTGNYTFFNLLTVSLCIFLLDDRILRKIFNSDLGGSVSNNTKLSSWNLIKEKIIIGFVFIMFLFSSAHTASRYFPDVKFPSVIHNTLSSIRPFGIINTYGLFSVMTTTRPELIIEKSENGKDWEEILFKWKAGKEDVSPGFVQPHQPRLDWQMWFAALFFEQVDEIYWQMNTTKPETFQDHAALMSRLRVPSGYHWFYRFLRKLLEGSPSVMSLLEGETETPKYLRVWIYNYHFTNLDQKKKTGHWWARDQKRILIPAFTLNDIQ